MYPFPTPLQTVCPLRPLARQPLLLVGVGTQMEDQRIIPGDEFTHLPDETRREAIDALPEGLNPGQAVYLLNPRDYRQLPKDDIPTLLSLCGIVQSPRSDLELDFKLWWDSRARGLGGLAKLKCRANKPCTCRPRRRLPRSCVSLGRRGRGSRTPPT
jgi:hypothetical protein